MQPSTPTTEREHFNNFNAVRLALAVLVIVSHDFPLSYGSEGSEPLMRMTAGQDNLGAVAVNFFFLISGMLITASWLRSKSMQSFLFKRVLRIYPGFLVASAVSVLIALVFSPAFRPAVRSAVWVYEFLRDLAFLGVSSLIQPSAFAGNPFPGQINGSLWTISIEFGCYILVAVLGLFCLFKRRKLILLFALGVWLFYGIKLFHGREVWRSEPRFLTYFFAGMLCWLFRDKIVGGIVGSGRNRMHRRLAFVFQVPSVLGDYFPFSRKLHHPVDRNGPPLALRPLDRENGPVLWDLSLRIPGSTGDCLVSFAALFGIQFPHCAPGDRGAGMVELAFCRTAISAHEEFADVGF
jgi:peptidoglycan/LPS O-acetylase OafA/YrhL